MLDSIRSLEKYEICWCKLIQQGSESNIGYINLGIDINM